jgi:hypothetical protein
MANDILITPGRSSIQFSGSITNNVELLVNSTGSVTFYGNRAGSTSKPILTVSDTGSGYVGIGLTVTSASLHTFSPSGGFAVYVQTPTQDAFVISAVGSANVMIGKTADDGINRLQIVGSVSASAFTGSFQGGATGSFTGSIQATGSVSGTFTGAVVSANARLSGSLTGSFTGLSTGSFSGSISATGSLTGSFTGQLTSANANLSGSLTGSLTGIVNASGSVSGTFTGAVTSATLIATGSVSGAFTGAVTSATARMTGSFSGSFAGQALATGSFTGSFKGDGSNLTGVVTTLAVTGALSSSGLMTSGTIDLKTQALTLSGSYSKGLYITFDAATDIATFDLAQSISQSAQVTFLAVSASSLTGSLTGSMFGTSSYALTASYALNAGLGYNTTQFTQNTPTASWIIPHTLRTQSPMVQVYDLSYNQIIPNAVIGVDNGTLKIEFLIPTTGYAMISNGGGLNPTGSQALLSQSSAAVTWSFAHNLNTKYPVFQIYGDNDEVLIPAGIKALSPSGSEIYFATPTTGVAVAEFSGTSGSFIGTVGDGLLSGSLTITGNLTVSGSITELSTRSAKSDIAPLSYSTADFMKLQPVSYTLKHTGTKEIGFIAEDVHNIYPEISKDGLSVSYTKFAPVLFQVIQEQQKRIERLEQMLKNNNNIS